MTDDAIRGGGQMPAGYIISITVNEYIALFTDLLQEQFLHDICCKSSKQTMELSAYLKRFYYLSRRVFFKHTLGYIFYHSRKKKYHYSVRFKYGQHCVYIKKKFAHMLLKLYTFQ